MSAGPLWTTADRAQLGRHFDGAPSDPRAAAALTREWCARLARAFPAARDGVEFIPLLTNILAGYNADLFLHASRFLRADAAAREMLGERARSHAVFPFGDMYLAEYTLGQRVRDRAGSFIVLRDEAKDGSAVERRWACRSESPGFEGFDFEIRADADQTAIPARSTAMCAPPARSVLFIASMNNYLQPMNPVMHALAERGARVTLLCPGAARSWPLIRAGGPGVQAVYLEDLITADLASLHRDQRAAVAERFNDSLDAVRDCFRVEGVDLWPLVRRDITRFILDHLPACAVLTELARRLMSELEPEACVVARLRRATESVLAASLRRRGVPVTMLIHGHVSARPQRAFDTGGLDADRICVWSRAQARQVLASHAPPDADRVVVTGNPAWDPLIRARAGIVDRDGARAAVARTLSLDAARPWAVLTAQDITAPQFPGIVAAFARQPRVTLIVKPHPAESPDWYRRRCADLPGALVLEHSRIDLHDLLRAADLTLTFSSTTNLESLILGTPVVTYAFGDLASQDRAAYLEECGLPLARTPDELAAILSTAAADPAAFGRSCAPAVERALQAFVGNYPAGDAAARAADVIESIAVRAPLAGAA